MHMSSSRHSVEPWRRATAARESVVTTCTEQESGPRAAEGHTTGHLRGTGLSLLGVERQEATVLSRAEGDVGAVSEHCRLSRQCECSWVYWIQQLDPGVQCRWRGLWSLRDRADREEFKVQVSCQTAEMAPGERALAALSVRLTHRVSHPFGGSAVPSRRHFPCPAVCLQAF